MQKIVPHLWFDKEAKEAAEFYSQVFPNTKITDVTTIHNTPSDDADIVSFNIDGYEFQAISAGPYFKPNPAISFMVNFDPSRDDKAEEHLNEIWEKLIDGGKILMPLDAYPFSKRYGWVDDKFGVSWQLILTDPDGEPRPYIIPSLMFTKEAYGKTEEAINFYVSVFGDGKVGELTRWGAGMEPEQEGKVMFSDFSLFGQWFAAMESANQHEFTFTEGVSLIVLVEDQEELDRYWNALSAVPESEQCGWLKDKFGVSWQIVPRSYLELLKGDPEKVARATQATLSMKKLDIAALEAAYNG